MWVSGELQDIFLCKWLGPLIDVSTSANQHVCFNIAEDQVLPFHLYHCDYFKITAKCPVVGLTSDWPSKLPDLNHIETCENFWYNQEKTEISITKI